MDNKDNKLLAERNYAWKNLRVQTRITGLDRLLYGGLTLSNNPYFILMKGALL